MGNKTNSVERVFSNSIEFKFLLNSIVDYKITELVQNANKVNTATSQTDQKEHDES